MIISFKHAVTTVTLGRQASFRYPTLAVVPVPLSLTIDCTQYSNIQSVFLLCINYQAQR
jgi:hypothetical protein